eukprot:1058160-Prymnesium_polylepis.1
MCASERGMPGERRRQRILRQALLGVAGAPDAVEPRTGEDAQLGQHVRHCGQARKAESGVVGEVG